MRSNFEKDWAELDVNKNGYLDKQEAEKFISKMFQGNNLGKKFQVLIFDYVDKNKDEKISRQELYNVAKKVKD